ncbi:MAG: M48 family metallopeptidase, partial [Euryarchaeota archaeon]|nr:M48 family metallopeptidase [Euryarchaeota archaeon]
VISSQIGESEKRTKIRQALINWYRSHAKKKILERVEKYQSKIGVTPAKVRVKKQRKRWGSCSTRGNLNFNWRIIMAPMSLVDYVVVHELVHLTHPNHSREFWGMVASVLPDYDERRERLRIKGNRLEF